MFGLNKIIPSNSNYQFMNFRKHFIILSIILIIFSLFLITFKGLNLGIDFKGGTLVEVSTKKSNIAELRKILNSVYSDVSLQEFGSSETIIIRLKNESNKESIKNIDKIISD